MMSKNPEPQADVPGGSSNESDYDALYAAIAATERGRHFLSEYAARNRHADTHMLVGALARVEAAVRGDPPPRRLPAPLVAQLSECALAVDRIDAAVRGPVDPAAAGLAVSERIRDIAFMLRERATDPALCDALDAALRDLDGALAAGDAAFKGSGSAAALLRALRGRIDAILADKHDARAAAHEVGAVTVARRVAAKGLGADRGPASASASGSDVVVTSDGADAHEDEDFAKALATLADTLTSSAAPTEPAGSIDIQQGMPGAPPQAVHGAAVSARQDASLLEISRALRALASQELRSSNPGRAVVQDGRSAILGDQSEAATARVSDTQAHGFEPVLADSLANAETASEQAPPDDVADAVADDRCQEQPAEEKETAADEAG
jgi:hypothetical protein